MLLFFQVLLTMFIAEMGDKTQLLMIAMTSRYKLRDIIIGSGLAVLALNALAVGAGAFISQFIPQWLIKLAAGIAFFYFAWSILQQEEEEEEEGCGKGGGSPILSVFGTFFLAELGDKTQLTAITFAANEGLEKAVIVWLACSVGLFAADLVGMLIGHLLKNRMPEGFLDKLAFVIFAIFGFTTLEEGIELLLGPGLIDWAIAGGFFALFAALCFRTFRRRRKLEQ
ncbi:MAG: TMEM165/GDT1 family protein [Oscillospiraceae bacterium]|nr:TMEM165/GDT1 family protein [Oscillospiraceae bacterium]